MFFIFSKILSFLLSPIWWTVILMFLYIVLRRYGKRRWFLLSAFVVLLVFSNQFLFYSVSGCWEGSLEKVDDLPKYDGLILLGGFSSYNEESDRICFNGSSDRLLQAMDLYHKGKAKYFIFTGGSSLILSKEREEGVFLEDYLKETGIKEEDLIIESKSRNTHENAAFTLEILKEEQLSDKRFILVTSAFHMKRALACFKKEGFNVVPYKTDPMHAIRRPDFADIIIPSAGTLAAWERLFREWVGYVVYKLKGYV